MKKLALASVLLALSSVPTLADDIVKKGVKLKATKEIVGNKDDSALKKGVKLKATKNIVDDKDDSALKKGVKLKVLKEAGDKN